MALKNLLPLSPVSSPAIKDALARIDKARAGIEKLRIPAEKLETALQVGHLMPSPMHPSVQIAPIAQRTDFLSTPLDLISEFNPYASGNAAGKKLSISPLEVDKIVSDAGYSPLKKLSVEEIRGYEAALQYVKKAVAKKIPLSQEVVQTIHALVMSEGYKDVWPSGYREGRHILRMTSGNGTLYRYTPPDPKLLPQLMEHMLDGLRDETIPCPLRACYAIYHMCHLHPFDDGNGRTARMLATMILYQGGYGFNHSISVEQMFADNLDAYYMSFRVELDDSYVDAIKRDAAPWLEYCSATMAGWFEKMLQAAKKFDEQK